MVDILAHGTGAGAGGLDSAMTKEFGGEATEESTALVRGTIKLGNFTAMAHGEETRAIEGGEFRVRGMELGSEAQRSKT